MKQLLLLGLLTCLISISNAQNSTDTLKKEPVNANPDDPSQFFTRIEIFNEFQPFKNDISLNVTTVRAIVKIGKKHHHSTCDLHQTIERKKNDFFSVISTGKFF